MIVFNVYAHLSGNTGLVDLVGDEIYPMVLPQREDPYPSDWAGVTYLKVSHPEVYSKSGPSGLSFPRIQITVWAKSYTRAKQVAEQVKAAMREYSEFNTKENDNDNYEPDTGLWQIPLDFIIHHKEVV